MSIFKITAKYTQEWWNGMLSKSPLPPGVKSYDYDMDIESVSIDYSIPLQEQSKDMTVFYKVVRSADLSIELHLSIIKNSIFYPAEKFKITDSDALEEIAKRFVGKKSLLAAAIAGSEDAIKFLSDEGIVTFLSMREAVEIEKTMLYP